VRKTFFVNLRPPSDTLKPGDNVASGESLETPGHLIDIGDARSSDGVVPPGPTTSQARAAPTAMSKPGGGTGLARRPVSRPPLRPVPATVHTQAPVPRVPLKQTAVPSMSTSVVGSDGEGSQQDFPDLSAKRARGPDCAPDTFAAPVVPPSAQSPLPLLVSATSPSMPPWPQAAPSSFVVQAAAQTRSGTTRSGPVLPSHTLPGEFTILLALLCAAVDSILALFSKPLELLPEPELASAAPQHAPLNSRAVMPISSAHVGPNVAWDKDATASHWGSRGVSASVLNCNDDDDADDDEVALAAAASGWDAAPASAASQPVALKRTVGGDCGMYSSAVQKWMSTAVGGPQGTSGEPPCVLPFMRCLCRVCLHH
jgi:hypothetical protein